MLRLNSCFRSGAEEPFKTAMPEIFNHRVKRNDTCYICQGVIFRFNPTQRRTLNPEPAVMTADQYVASVIQKYAVNTASASPASKAANHVIPVLKAWAGQSLLGIQFSGSYAKGTTISLGTDVDLFISLDSTQPVKDIYWSLFNYAAAQQLRPQAQNVSIRVQSNGLNVDLVPGRKQRNSSEDHSLYKRKKDSWVQTNVAQHIRIVSTSGRIDEIRAIKIWRERHHLDLPSFYLELATIDALKGNRIASLAERVMTVLRYLASDFKLARIVDPANTNNIISDDLGPEEKRVIAFAAQKSQAMQKWSEILW